MLTVSRDLPSDTQFDEARWPNPSVLARKSCQEDLDEIDHVPWKNLIVGKFREGRVGRCPRSRSTLITTSTSRPVLLGASTGVTLT